MDQLIGKAHAAESSPSFPTTTTNNLEGERRRDNHLPRLSAREFDVFLPVAAASTTKKKTDALDGRLEEKTVDGECILHNFTVPFHFFISLRIQRETIRSIQVENLNDLTSAGLTLGAFDFRLFGLYAGLSVVFLAK